jgi:hypothetical protein
MCVYIDYINICVCIYMCVYIDMCVYQYMCVCTDYYDAHTCICVYLDLINVSNRRLFTVVVINIPPNYRCKS